MPRSRQSRAPSIRIPDLPGSTQGVALAAVRKRDARLHSRVSVRNTQTRHVGTRCLGEQRDGEKNEQVHAHSLLTPAPDGESQLFRYRFAVHRADCEPITRYSEKAPVVRQRNPQPRGWPVWWPWRRWPEGVVVAIRHSACAKSNLVSERPTVTITWASSAPGTYFPGDGPTAEAPKAV